MATCKSCGKQIIWIKTASGNRMPCDPDLVPYWSKPKAKGKVVTPNGEVLRCDFDGDFNQATGLGYVSHWATCPSADAHRKGMKRHDGS